MENFDISIICPMYNESDIAHKSLTQLIDLAKNCELKIEILVIDDCSNDGSLEIINNLSSEIKILSTQKNSGSGGAPRNIGIENASGRYLSFYDMGDTIFLQQAAKYIEFMDEFDINLTIFKHQDISPNNTIHDTPINIFRDVVYSTDFGETPSLISNPFSWSKIYKTSWLRENSIKFGTQYLGQDKQFTWISYLKCKNIIISPTIFYQHKFYPGTRNRMLNNNLRSAQSLISIDEAVRQEFENHKSISIYNQRLINRDILGIILGKEGIKKLISNRELFHVFDLLKNWLNDLNEKHTNLQAHTHPSLLKRYNQLIAGDLTGFIFETIAEK